MPFISMCSQSTRPQYHLADCFAHDSFPPLWLMEIVVLSQSNVHGLNQQIIMAGCLGAVLALMVGLVLFFLRKNPECTPSMDSFNSSVLNLVVQLSMTTTQMICWIEYQPSMGSRVRSFDSNLDFLFFSCPTLTKSMPKRFFFR